MEAFIKIRTMEYPRFIGDIHLEFPDWTDDQPLPEGWGKIIYEETPDLDPYTVRELSEPELQSDGTWLVIWKQPRNMTEEERLDYDAHQDLLNQTEQPSVFSIEPPL